MLFNNILTNEMLFNDILHNDMLFNDILTNDSYLMAYYLMICYLMTYYLMICYLMTYQLSTKIYDKRDDFNFEIINFPNMCSNIPASPAYGVYISQIDSLCKGQ
jgi:hypothetical protein